MNKTLWIKWMLLLFVFLGDNQVTLWIDEQMTLWINYQITHWIDKQMTMWMDD